MMTKKVVYSLLIICLISPVLLFVESARSEDWESLAPGIDYREYYLPDPNIVYVARMDRNQPHATIDTSIALGKLSGGLEVVRNQAERHDGAINFWGSPTIPHTSGGWGSRNRVVVAINGTFSLPPSFDQPWEGQISSGWYAWPFQDRATRNSFIWKIDREAFIGDCVSHPDSKQIITYQNNKTQMIDGVNQPRGNDELIVFTPQYNRDTLTDDSGIEVLVELISPTLLSHPDQVAVYIRAIHSSIGSTPIPFDHIVLSAAGAAASIIMDNARIGDRLGVTQFLRNCDDSSTLDWNKTYASIVSNRFYFLKDGQIQQYSDPDSGYYDRDPRTAVAFNEDYVYFIVVDGRYPGRSIGMSMEHLAAFARDSLKADHGLALDGGGSSTMVVNGEVRNFPSDGIQINTGSNDKKPIDIRTLSMLEDTSSSKVFIPYLVHDYNNAPVPPEPEYPLVERPVPNGLLMVYVEPREQTTTLRAGDQVIVYAYGSANLRLGPGTNYGVLTYIPTGTEGEIVEHMNGLNGIRAKGYNWWRVRFGEHVGWMAERLLIKQ